MQDNRQDNRSHSDTHRSYSQRGRNPRPRMGGSPTARSILESNGPEGKVRGTLSHLYERYLTLARDAHTTGQSVLAESYLQHAEHYLRQLNTLSGLGTRLEVEVELANRPRTEFDRFADRRTVAPAETETGSSEHPENTGDAPRLQEHRRSFSSPSGQERSSREYSREPSSRRQDYQPQRLRNNYRQPQWDNNRTPSSEAPQRREYSAPQENPREHSRNGENISTVRPLQTSSFQGNPAPRAPRPTPSAGTGAGAQVYPLKEREENASDTAPDRRVNRMRRYGNYGTPASAPTEGNFSVPSPERTDPPAPPAPPPPPAMPRFLQEGASPAETAPLSSGAPLEDTMGGDHPQPARRGRQTSRSERWTRRKVSPSSEEAAE